ncbi:DUF5681 domain-containing protein [Dyadobacter sp. CY327]|uniref:DUF5681 domain-containing protein n=1 Tax=Dyadobacter sp. CY327 TaxID=2907301 RepID=UPI001F3BD6FE|nr:DUF5681 domain-containing protein [Dyadobacter sp. CY327]MCE7073681.1 DUF5681 domain-containing protein [Dyadobacter sp. CY327]
MTFPNPDTQFQPGESGNPKGKPKGTLNRSTIVRRWLEAKGQEGETVADDLVLAAIREAMDGSAPHLKELLDSAFGKITDKVDMNNPDGNLTPVVTVTFIKPKDE